MVAIKFSKELKKAIEKEVYEQLPTSLKSEAEEITYEVCGFVKMKIFFEEEQNNGFPQKA